MVLLCPVQSWTPIGTTMQITKITTHVLKTPLGKERFYSSQAAFPERTSLLVRLETDTGLVGWGEGGQYGPPEPVAACIHAVLGSQVLGSDPRNPAVLWERLYSMIRDFGQKGPYLEAISAIDIACWDLLGQATGLPVHTLLGGAFRESVTAYATGCYYRGEHAFGVNEDALQALADEARSYVEDGFRILKIKLGLLSIEADVRRIEVIREAIGPNVTLLADANHAYNVSNALRVGRELERLDVRWFEEPIVPEDLEGYRHLRQKLAIPIAGGECEYTRYGFRNLFAQGCVDIAQPDLCCAGGFSEFLKIQALALAHHTPVIPHVWGSGIALATALHALAATPWQPYTYLPVALQNEPVVEYDRNPNPLRDDILEQPFKLVEGKVAVPSGPGLGVTIVGPKLDKFTVTRQESKSS